MASVRNIFPENKEEAQQLLETLRPFFEDESSEKIGQNLKYDIKVLAKYNISVKGKLFDTMLAHYLINPDMRHNMDVLSETYLNYTPVSITELIGKKGKNQKKEKKWNLFIKAKGVGMSLPLSSFDVSVGPDAPPALLATRWNPSEVNRWTIHALDPGGDYAGSLAVQGTDLQVACWQWSD